MSRPIKFRAWDKKRQKMFFVGGFNWHEKTWSYYVWDGKETVSDDDIELMQFTGLHDKNGKEIWEGDILKSHWNDSAGVIRFGDFKTAEGDPDCCGNVNTHVGFYWDAETEASMAFGYDKNGKTDKYEVLGNIYENPELLK